MDEIKQMIISIIEKTDDERLLNYLYNLLKEYTRRVDK